MISNLRTDLKRMNLEDRAPEILEEAEQVRIDLGSRYWSARSPST